MLAKYDLSILAIFKNEESFLQEWINHYFNRNIDHIYLLNDGSNDSSVSIVQNHPNKKNITLLHTSKEDQEYDLFWRQKYLYNKYFNYILNETKWVGIFDLDEFCYSPEEVDFKKILLAYDNIESIQQLVVDWYWFGSNNLENQPKNIVGSFNKRGKELSKKISASNQNINNIYSSEWCCKSFAKTEFIKELCHHFNIFYSIKKIDYIFFPFLSFNSNISNNGLMFINHYIGSKNYYFNNKISRGSCNRYKKIVDNKAVLYDYINLNEIEDNRLKNQNLLRKY